MLTFFMTIGIPGSGKSTFLNKFPKDIIVSPDRIRAKISNINDQTKNNIVWKIALDNVVDLLNSGSDAILDATNVVSKNRSNFIKSLKNNVFIKFRTAAIVFNISTAIAKKRIKNDIMANVNRADVPDHVIDRMYSQLTDGYNNIKIQFDSVITIP